MGATPLVRILDWNPGINPQTQDESQNISIQNLIPFEVGMLARPLSYQELSGAERSWHFENFLYRILRNLEAFEVLKIDNQQAPVGIIHIDHHYPHPALREISTSVLSLDFLLWLHESAAWPRKANAGTIEWTKESVLRALALSIPVLDHADSDILLANLVFDRAEDINFLRTHQELIRGISLFNDYLDLPPSDQGPLRLKIEFAQLVLQEVERNVLSPLPEEQEAWQVDKVRELLKSFPAFIEHLFEKLHFASPEGLSPLELLYQEIKIDQRDRYRPALDLDSRVVHASQEVEYGPLFLSLFLQSYHREREQIGSVSQSFRQLQSREAGLGQSVPEGGIYELAHGAYLSVANIQGTPASLLARVANERLPSPARILVSLILTERQNYKIMLRSAPGIDLTEVYASLQAEGLDAGGRPRAGSAAYGKRGLRFSEKDQLMADLRKVVLVVERFLGDCSRVITDLN